MSHGVTRVDTVHAWVVVDDDGTEGIPVVSLSGLDRTPLMCGSQSGAVAVMATVAESWARTDGRPIFHRIYSEVSSERVQ